MGEINRDEIEQAAIRLRNLDHDVVEAIIRDDFSALPGLLEEFSTVKHRIQAAQIEPSVVPSSSEEARSVLRQLREGKPFHADQVIALSVDNSDSETLPDELTDAEIDELGSDYFYSWFSGREYIRNLYGLGTLIVAADIPKRNRVLLQEARQCYAFEQYHAVLALCRAFIEATARDICEQLGLIGTDEDKPISPKERGFSPLAGEISQGELRRRVNSLYYGRASPVVHGAKSVTQADARKAIKDTLSLAEDLYRANEL